MINLTSSEGLTTEAYNRTETESANEATKLSTLNGSKTTVALSTTHSTVRSSMGSDLPHRATRHMTSATFWHSKEYDTQTTGGAILEEKNPLKTEGEDPTAYLSVVYVSAKRTRQTERTPTDSVMTDHAPSDTTNLAGSSTRHISSSQNTSEATTKYEDGANSQEIETTDELIDEGKCTCM